MAQFESTMNLFNSSGSSPTVFEVVRHVFQKHPVAMSIAIAVPILALIYYFYEVAKIRSFDNFIDWVASWPIFIVKEILHFYLRLLQDIIKGLKSIVMDFFHGLVNAFKF